VLQDELLPAAGVLRGNWVCTECGYLVQGPDTGVVADRAVERPLTCTRCNTAEFRYVELFLVNEEYRVCGHCDGILVLPQQSEPGILECKSIGPRGAVAVQRAPQYGHVFQTQAYMWLTGLRWGRILYWQKAEFGMKALLEHHVDYDESMVQEIQAKIRSVWDTITTGALPERICSYADCDRANECSVKGPCFAP
jgi:hypothetical protein